MTSLTRWRLACALLALVTAFEVFDHQESAPPALAPSRTRGAGVSTVLPKIERSDPTALVHRLLAARTLTEIRVVAQQLGTVGNDWAIDQIRPMVFDQRPGVASVIFDCIGKIGSDHAVEVLAEYAQTRDFRYDAIMAIGTTHNERAEPVLERFVNQSWDTAISALGELGTDRAIDRLVEIATSSTDEPQRIAIAALGESDSPAAIAALRGLIDSPASGVAALAIASLTTIDDEMFEKLSGIVAANEGTLVEQALSALANAGERALPILREAALHGAATTRNAAIYALARLRSPEALSILGTVLDTADGETAKVAGDALVMAGTAQARELVIKSALSPRGAHNGTIDLLLDMAGADVEQALLTIAKHDSERRDSILAHLLDVGNADATEIATSLIMTGDEESRVEALSIFGTARSAASTKMLLRLAREQTGAVQVEAIRLLGRRAGEPEVAHMLQNTLENGTPEAVAAAARALASAGTVEARNALVAALSNGDDELTATAMNSLRSFRLTEDVEKALLDAAHANPELVPEVMQRLITDGSKAGYELARAAIAGESDQVGEALAALREAGTPEAFKTIEGALSAHSPDVRRAALEQLAYARTPDVEESVLTALHDSDASVRSSAVRATAVLDSDRSRQALATMVRDTDQNVAYNAVQYLVGNDDVLKTVVLDTTLGLEVRTMAFQNLRDRSSIDPKLAEQLGENPIYYSDPDRSYDE